MTTTNQTSTSSSRADALFASAKIVRDELNEIPFDDERWSEMASLSSALIMEGLRHAEVGDQVRWSDYDQTLTIAGKSKTFGTITLTSDGGIADVARWHDGSESEWIYYERWNLASGREGHGWVDAESRRLLQAG